MSCDAPQRRAASCRHIAAVHAEECKQWQRRHDRLRGHVTHLTAVWIRLCAAEYTASHLVNSSAVRLQSCAVKHANEGQFCNRPHEYHMHACAVGCSLTCAALLLLNVFGIVRYSGAMQGVWKVDCAQQGSPMQAVQSQPQISAISAIRAASCTSSRAFQAVI